MTCTRPRLFRLFVFCVVLLGAAMPRAHAAASVERLMDVSGLRHTLTQLPGVIAASLDAPQPGADVPPQVRVAMKDAAAQAFRAQDLVAAVRDHFARSLTERQVADAIAFYETLLGRRITDLERKSAEASAMREYEAYVAGLSRQAVPEARRRLIDAYDAATDSTEAVAAIMESTALAVALGMNASQPRQAQVSSQELQRRLKAATPQFKAQARAHVGASLLFTYRMLDDRDLAEYVRFLQGTSGAGYARASSQAFRRVIADAMTRLMQALPRALERARGSVQA